MTLLERLAKAADTFLHPPLRPAIQILSDLHLDVGHQYTTFTFPVCAPILLLAGDVGRLADYDGYRAFLAAQAPRYRIVLLVLGNHEFYGTGYERGLEEARRLEREPELEGRLVLLDKARWDDPDSDLTVLGCTLWSAVPEEDYGVVRAKINDFRKIRGWTIENHVRVHDGEVAWLRDQVAQLTSLGKGEAEEQEGLGRRVLVATHHAPCVVGTSRPKDACNPWTSAYATDLLDKGGWDGVGVWVFGHTHYSADFMWKGVRVVANQRGYVLPGSNAEEKERQRTRRRGGNAREFDPSMVISM